MRRSAYTLLEILLALAIAMLLLGALYVAVDVQLRSAQAGRERVEQSTLIRSIFSRMDQDAALLIAQPDPARFRTPQSLSSGGSSSSGGTTGASSTGTSSTGASSTGASSTGASSTTTPMSGSSGSSNSAASLSMSGTVSTYTNPNSVQVIVLPYGVIGDSQTLNLFISRVPRTLVNQQLQQNEASSPPVGDLRRVSYWLQEGDGGLVKQEVKLITAEDSGVIDGSGLPPNVDNPTDPDNGVKTLATEVKSLQFEYFDGTEWTDSWDSTEPNSIDNMTPIGSPVAIRITIGLAQPNTSDLKMYQHVVVIATANNPTAQQTNPNTGGGTTSP